MHPTRIFKTPEDLFDAWENYRKHLQTKALEWPKVQYVGKDGMRVEDYPKLPLTMDGFEVYCFQNYGCVNQYFDNKQGYYDDFVTICSHIKRQIREDQITGGLLGNYNASITQRLNGLKEQTENNNTNTHNILNIDPLDDSIDNGTT
jgi:hypothetical protein